MPGHLRARLRAEVLDDHLLDVAVLAVQAGDRLQRLDPLLARLADADQDPGRERDAQLAREAQRLEPRGRLLVGRAEMRAAARGEPVGGGLEHDPLGGRHLAERRKLVAGHDARVRVRKQARLLEDELAHPRQVLDRRLAAERPKLLARDLVAELRLVAEREERLGAAGRRTGAGDVEHLVGRKVGALAAAGRAGEGAVVADVPAELRQRDEDLGRVGDDRACGAGSWPRRGAPRGAGRARGEHTRGG